MCGVSSGTEELNRRMLRARDAIDRAYSQPLDVPNLAEVARVSEAHFMRTFKATFGETPHRHLHELATAPNGLPRTLEPPKAAKA